MFKPFWFYYTFSKLAFFIENQSLIVKHVTWGKNLHYFCSGNYKTWKLCEHKTLGISETYYYRHITLQKCTIKAATLKNKIERPLLLLFCFCFCFFFELVLSHFSYACYDRVSFILGSYRFRRRSDSSNLFLTFWYF